MWWRKALKKIIPWHNNNTAVHSAMMYYRHKRILLIAIFVLVAVLSFFFLFRFCTSKPQLPEGPNPSSKIEDPSPKAKRGSEDLPIDRKYDKKDTGGPVNTEEENGKSFLSKYGKKSNYTEFDEMPDDTNDKSKWNNREVLIDDWDNVAQWNPSETDITFSDSSDDSPNGNPDDADTNDKNDWLSPNGEDDTIQTIDKHLSNGGVGDDFPKIDSNYRRNPEWEGEPARDVRMKTSSSEDDGGNGRNVKSAPSFKVPSSPQRGLPSIGMNPVWIVILVILLIVSIIANLMSNRGILVVWAIPFDKFLVTASAILFFIACIIDGGPELTGVQITLLSFSGLLMLVSIILSIITNMGSLLNIILSILSKLFVFVIVNFSLLLLIVVMLVYFMIKIAKKSHE